MSNRGESVLRPWSSVSSVLLPGLSVVRPWCTVNIRHEHLYPGLTTNVTGRDMDASRFIPDWPGLNCTAVMLVRESPG